MKTIYIAGPFRGVDGFAVYKNVVRAEGLMHELIGAALDQGTPVAVLCPHSMTVHLDRTFDDNYWLAATMEWLDRSDAILMLPEWEKSMGSTDKRRRAITTGKAVLSNVQTALAFLRGEKVGVPID